LTEQHTAFESGFLGEPEDAIKRTGEYLLGDAAAEILAQQAAPEMQPPDELTIKRRMRTLRRGNSFRTKVYPLASAAIVALTVIILVTQFSDDRGDCGRLNGVQVLSCSTDQAATFASIQRAYPDGTLVQAMRDRPPVAVPVSQLVKTLDTVKAKYIVFQIERDTIAAVSHGLVLTTLSEAEFDTVKGSLAKVSATRSVAQELARIKEQDNPTWDGTTPRSSVVSLVNIN